MNSFTKVAAAVAAGVAVLLGASLVAVNLIPTPAEACHCYGHGWGHGAASHGHGQGWAGYCPCPMCSAAVGFETEKVDRSDPTAALYDDKCGSCHALPSRKIHAAKEWDDVVARMEVYAERHEKTMGMKGVTMSPAERKRIMDYLEASAPQ
ncbi:MAG: hypothetical protein V3W11_04415 [bacterium]